MYSGDEIQLKQKGVIRFSVGQVLIILYIAHKLLPAVGYYMPSVVYLGLFGVTAIMLLPLLRYKVAWMMAGMFSVSLLGLILKLGNPTGAALYFYGELQIYLYGMITLWVIFSGGQNAARRAFTIIMLMYMITAVTTIFGNEKYPQASRFLATMSNDDMLYGTYTKANIGSFVFVYELVLVAPLLVYLTRSKIIKPVLGYGLLALSAIAIFSTEYGMAVILFAASLLLLVIPKLTTKRLIILLVIVLVVVILFTGLVAELFELVSRNIKSETLSERFLAIAQTLRGEDEVLEDGTGAQRIEFYKKAWDTFWTTYGMGAWGTVATGGHTFILDTMANYGILGIVALAVFFLMIYQLCLKPYRKEPFFPYLLWICILGGILMVMNPKNYQFIYICILPLFTTAFKSLNGSENYEVSLDRE